MENTSPKIKIGKFEIFIFRSILVIIAVFLLILLSNYLITSFYGSKHTEIEKEILYYLKSDTVTNDTVKYNTALNKEQSLSRNSIITYFNENQIQTYLNKSIYSYLAKIVTIILSIFTALMTGFTFFTQWNMKRAEEFKKEAEEFKKEAEGYKKEAEGYKNEIGIIKNEMNEYKEVLDNKIKESANEITNKAVEITDINYEKQMTMFENSKQLFIVLNSFLANEYKLDHSLIPDILDLWNPARINFAIMSLIAKDKSKKSLPYLKQRKNELTPLLLIFEKSDNVKYKTLATTISSLDQAIEIIENNMKI